MPFAFPLAWDEGKRIVRFQCHELVADPMTAIFAESARHYGEVRFRQLLLDRFGGCFADRNMRGSKSKSMHAWGIAVDIDPANNGLSWTSSRATLARPEYEPFWRIVESHGGVSLGRTANRDWMHFQFARFA